MLLISSLWIRASRWTENTTEKCCCRRNCCLRCVKCPGISLSFNKTVHPHTEHETLFSFFNVILQNSSHQICGHLTAQIWILLTIKSGVWCSKGVPNENSWHRRSEGASDRRVAWTAAVCRGWSHRWMAQTFAIVCSCQRRAFRTVNLD